ncbi:hypothetical protein GF325_06975 [Candidatus Bathyarchaeota archaeon]|nr:hypothetical protein [Candidatus Bathyarchaeota archaeon]
MDPAICPMTNQIPQEGMRLLQETHDTKEKTRETPSRTCQHSLREMLGQELAHD